MKLLATIRAALTHPQTQQVIAVTALSWALPVIVALAARAREELAAAHAEAESYGPVIVALRAEVTAVEDRLAEARRSLAELNHRGATAEPDAQPAAAVEETPAQEPLG